jgi:hypothetical protein
VQANAVSERNRSNARSRVGPIEPIGIPIVRETSS